MIKGEIEILIRDSVTMEVVERIIQPNIVTNKLFGQIVSNSVDAFIKGSIVAVSLPISPSRTNVYIPSNMSGCTSVLGIPIPGNGNPDWFPKNGLIPAFAQWSTRLNLPAATRTISTVMLTDMGNGDSNQWMLNQAYQFTSQSPNLQAFAYSRLATPCTQTTTQFFDIYYRVYFPFTNQHDMPDWVYQDMIKRLSGSSTALWQNNSADYKIYSNVCTNALPMVNPNPGDESICWPSRYGVGGSLSTTAIVTAPYFRRKYTQNFALVDFPGTMMSALYFQPGNYIGVNAAVPVNIGTKIQNLLGHRLTSQMPFLDVSNFQQGSGSLTLGGAWENRGTPVSPGLFASGQFPMMNFVYITGTGAVGTSTYNYVKRPFTGSFNNEFNWKTTITFLPYISQSMGTGGPAPDPEIGSNLLGDLTKCGVRQLSSWCKYDDTSIVIVKQDQIIIYNIATGTYWSFHGAFTDIRQVCVIGTKVYIACYNTGLYMIDPVNSLTVTAIPAPGSGIDLSATYGTARGFNNMLWVIGKNCLASFDGTTWTKYDSTTAIPFNSPGISDGNWSNAEYLVVDEENVNNSLFIVRSYSATVNAASLGVWWSTVGSAFTMANDSISISSSGQPRLNRSHVGGKNGIWIAHFNNKFWKMSFGVTTFSSYIYQSGGSLNGIYSGYSSVMFVKNSAGSSRLLNIANNEYYSYPAYYPYGWTNPMIKLYDGNLTLEASSLSALTTNSYNRYDVQNYASSNIATSGNADLVVSFTLGNGVIFAAGFKIANPYDIHPHFASHIAVYPFDITPTGGSLAYIGQSTYGWNGSNWTTSVSTSKPTHLTTDALDSGVTLSFANGAGTSFLASDWYNFVTCEGLQKDSATTGGFEYSFYYKRAYRDKTELSSATIPVTAVLAQSGVVGLDLIRCSSSDITIAANQVIFDGANPQQYAVGDKHVTGNFSISYTPFNSPNAHYIAFGIGHASTGQILYGFVINNDSIYICDTPNDTYGVMAYPTYHGSFGSFSSSAALDIRRVAGVLQFWVNGVLRWSVTPPLNQIRWDLICSPWNDSNMLYWTTQRTCPMVTIVANGTDNAVKIGHQIDSSGSYNPLFYAIDGDTRNTNTVLINGTPAIAYHYDGTFPGATEVTIDPYMGTLHFNPADEGKTVQAVYTYMTHE